MKKKIFIGILVVVIVVILSFVIPVKIEKKEVWHVEGLTSYGGSANFYYNIYGMKIWPKLGENQYVREN